MANGAAMCRTLIATFASKHLISPQIVFQRTQLRNKTSLYHATTNFLRAWLVARSGLGYNPPAASAGDIRKSGVPPRERNAPVKVRYFASETR